ncbi:sperm acrosome membrane-associated protein 4-like, partial [Chelydra serpentina]
TLGSCVARLGVSGGSHTAGRTLSPPPRLGVSGGSHTAGRTLSRLPRLHRLPRQPPAPDATMGSPLLLGLAVLTCAGLGVALQCLKCDYTASNAPCSAQHPGPTPAGRAPRGHYHPGAGATQAGHKTIVRKNCVDEAKCSTQDTATWAGVTYATSYTCCQGDFCN